MSATCKTCRWWHQTWILPVGAITYRKCAGGIDVSAFESADEYLDLNGSEPLLKDSDGGSANMFTGPDFGCVHHDPK